MWLTLQNRCHMPAEARNDAPEPTVEEILAEVERRRAARRAKEALYRSPWEQRPTRWTERVGRWFVRHWLAILNLWWFLYVGISFLAPVLIKADAEGPARLIYLAYQPSVINSLTAPGISSAKNPFILWKDCSAGG